ncbi:MAG: hypothetical protein MK098_08400 [Marinovum sp.]|nr:hypothetical protein [Marinovum sp.]
MARLICFVGHRGVGKTTVVEATLKNLGGFWVRRHRVEAGFEPGPDVVGYPGNPIVLMRKVWGGVSLCPRARDRDIARSYFDGGAHCAHVIAPTGARGQSGIECTKAQNRAYVVLNRFDVVPTIRCYLEQCDA